MRLSHMRFKVWRIMVLVAMLAFAMCESVRYLPKGPRSGQEAINAAKNYAEQTKPSYPFDEYEASASWDGESRCWVVRFVAHRPLIHTQVKVYYDDGRCEEIPVHYSPVIKPRL